MCFTEEENKCQNMVSILECQLKPLQCEKCPFNDAFQIHLKADVCH